MFDGKSRTASCVIATLPQTSQEYVQEFGNWERGFLSPDLQRKHFSISSVKFMLSMVVISHRCAGKTSGTDESKTRTDIEVFLDVLFSYYLSNFCVSYRILYSSLIEKLFIIPRHSFTASY